MNNTMPIEMQLILAALGGLIVGALLVWLMMRGKKNDVALKAAQDELSSYRQQVNQHFIDAADAVDELTRSYQKVFAHLSRGAENLMENEAYQAELNKRVGKTVTLTYLTNDAAVQEVEVVQARQKVAASVPPVASADIPEDVPMLPQNNLDEADVGSATAVPPFAADTAAAPETQASAIAVEPVNIEQPMPDGETGLETETRR